MKISYQYPTGILAAAFLLVALPQFADARIGWLEDNGEPVEEKTPPPRPPTPSPYINPDLPPVTKEDLVVLKKGGCEVYQMSHIDETYETQGITSNHLAWGLHALQWKGYLHIAAGGTFDEDLAKISNPPSVSSSTGANAIGCNSKERLDMLEKASSGIFKTNGQSTDPNGTWNCATETDYNTAIIVAAMNMHKWSTPVYVDARYPSSDVEGFAHYFQNGCSDLPPTFCGDLVGPLSYCKYDGGCPGTSNFGRSICHGQANVLSPCDVNDENELFVEAYVFKEVEMCAEGTNGKPHVACNWDNTSIGDAGTCDTTLTIKRIVGGVFYAATAGTPSYYEDNVEIPWSPYTYGNANGGAPELVFDPPAGTTSEDIAVMLQTAQRSAKKMSVIQFDEQTEQFEHQTMSSSWIRGGN